MSPATSHDELRPSLPHSRRVPIAADDPDRAQGRTAGGQFAPDHGLSYTKGWRQFFADVLGRDAGPDAPDASGRIVRQYSELGRKAWRLYRGFVAELPCVNVSVRSLCAQRARAATLADYYSALGMRAGPHSDKGVAWLEQALKWDQRAERLAVTATDLSARASKAPNRRRVIDVHAVVARAFAPPGEGPP